MKLKEMISKKNPFNSGYYKSNDLKIFSNEIKANYGNVFDEKNIESFSKPNFLFC